MQGGRTQEELITPTCAANLAEYMLVHVPSIKADPTAIAYPHGARAVLSRDFFRGENVASLERGDAMTKITNRIRAVLTARAES
ncbi:Tyr recombinase domain-containing protein [Plasmodiophora brassicae]